MFTVIGEYAECIVHTNEIEPEALTQIYGFLNHPAFEDTIIRIMPDVHAGKGSVVGFTSTLGKKIIPNVVGVDIGCGVAFWNLGNIEIDYAALDKFIRENIPHGFKVNARQQKKHFDTQSLEQIKATIKETSQDENFVLCSLGSLGGGNHFIEIGENEKGEKGLSIHTGSRNFGLRVCQHHQKIADKEHSFGDLSYLEGDSAQSYLFDMKSAQRFAEINRHIIGYEIMCFLKALNRFSEKIESVHNYIDFKEGFIRKGAVSALYGQDVVIPFNMRDGLIIGKGKGEADWNFSAPHGAGRRLSRRKAKTNLSLEEFKEQMKDVWSTSVSEHTLDESPMAYKETESILSLLKGNVEVTDRFIPKYNFKASEYDE